MKRIGIWAMVFGCMSMWPAPQDGSTAAVAEENVLGLCWDGNDFVQKETRDGQICGGPGSYCVEEEICAWVGGPFPIRFRKVTGRHKTSNCVQSDATNKCKACPQGSVMVCATVEFYRHKDIQSGQCYDFVKTDKISMGNCSAEIQYTEY